MIELKLNVAGSMVQFIETVICINLLLMIHFVLSLWAIEHFCYIVMEAC